MRKGPYHVYIMGGASRTTYVGFTNTLVRRVREHKNKIDSGFTAKYNLDQLLFYVDFPTAIEGIAYEKKLKRWSNAKKEALIATINSERVDLAADWCGGSERKEWSRRWALRFRGILPCVPLVPRFTAF